MALKALGKITVTNPGTPVQLTANQSTPSARYGVQSLSIFNPSTNTGTIYVGIGASFSKTTYINLLGIIPKNTWWTAIVNLAPTGLNAADYYLDADNANDVGLVVGTEQ